MYGLSMWLLFAAVDAVCIWGVTTNFGGDDYRDWFLDGCIVLSACLAVSLLVTIIDLILYFVNRKRALQALHDARVEGVTLVFDALDPRFQQFVEEEWGVGGRNPWSSSPKTVIAYVIVSLFYGGVIFGIVLLRVWAANVDFPPLMPLAVWCFAGSQLYGTVFFLIKAAVTNRAHYTLARDCGGVAALSRHSFCFNGDVHIRAHGAITICDVRKVAGHAPYAAILTRRGRRLVSLNVPILTEEHERALVSRL